MRLFKAHEPERSEEDEAAAMRLMAITNRIRPRDSAAPETSQPPESDEPEDPQ